MTRAHDVPTLLVMVKAPIAGAVKTRLARTIGDIEALRFYRGVTAVLLRRLAQDRRWRTILAVTPDQHLGSRFWPVGMARVAQGRGELGSRMQRLLEAPSRGPVILIGSDIPGIGPHHIAEAFRIAKRCGAVLGPSQDGGFWLIGARRPPAVLRPFEGVRWSSEHALADTLAKITGPVGFVPRLQDIDTESDWRRWRRATSDLLRMNGTIR